MGKPNRSRSRPPVFPKAAQEFRSNWAVTRKTSMALPTKRSCGASRFVLILLAVFGLVLFILFIFTLGPGNHASVGWTAEAAQGLKKNSEIQSMKVDDSVDVYSYEIIRKFKHDPYAYTQGLTYAGNGTLYESTGLYGKSSVRVVDLQTGEVRKAYQMKSQDFGEGLTIWKNRLLQVVWRDKKVIMYDRETLTPVREIRHQMQDGWGLTSSNDHVIGSDGTSKLYFMNPKTLKEVRVVTVKDAGKEVGWLNELEFVDNEIWANVWQANCIAKISPDDGRVTGWILLHGLRNELLKAGFTGIDVLNGIAWDEEQNKLYVTGKLWPTLYNIQIVPKNLEGELTLQSVRKFCNVGREGFQ